MQSMNIDEGEMKRHIKKILLVFVSFIIFTCVYLYQLGPITSEPEPNTHEMQIIELTQMGKGRINDLEVSPNGKFLAMATTSGLWLYDFDLSTMSKVNKQVINKLSWSPKSEKIAMATEQNILLWDRENGNEEINTDYGIKYSGDILWSPNGKLIAAFGNGHNLIVWDSNTLTEVSTINLGDSFLDSIAWSKDSKTIFSAASYGGTIKSWDIKTGSQLFEFEDSQKFGFGISISPDGSKLVSGSTQEGIKIWEINKPDKNQNIFTNIDYLIDTVEWSPDGNNIAITGRYGIQVYSVAMDKIIRCVRFDNFHKNISWFPNSKELAINKGNGSVQILNLDSGMTCSKTSGNTQNITSLSWSPDGKRIASSGDDGFIRIWDTETWQEQSAIKGGNDIVNLVSWSPDSQKIASGGNDGGIKIWDSKTLNQINDFDENSEIVNAIAWSPDGTRIAVGDDEGYINIWNLDFQNLEYALKVSSHIYSISWSPDGKYLASGGYDKDLIIWDMTYGRKVRVYPNLGTEVSWAPESNMLISADYDGNIRFLDTNIWRFTKSAYMYHTDSWGWGRVYDMQWSPNETFISMKGSDYSHARIWGVNAGKVLADVEGVEHITWSPDETMFAGTSGDGIIRIYKITK